MENLIHIKTGTGLEIDVDPSVYDDMELLDSCYEVQENNNFLALPAVLRHLLTEPARKALYAHIRAVHGRVRVEPLLDEIMDIMGQMAAANQEAADAPAPTPAPEPAPEPLFPGNAPDPDKSQPPPAMYVDTVMAKLHGVLHSNPAQADKLEKATRAALDVASVESAWHLLDNITAEIEATYAAQMVHEAISDLVGDPPEPRQSDPVPSGPGAVTANFVRAGTMPDAAQAAQASATFTPWDELKADPEPAEEASSAAE